MPNPYRDTARIFVILARDVPVAVVIRRGPSRRVQILRWDTKTDEFEPGQWFKGRIHERRCDISPSGKYFLYFAARYRYGCYPLTWTAVSKPPYLTALSLWDSDGSVGGGMFETDERILVNVSFIGLCALPGSRKCPRIEDVQLVPFSELKETELYRRRLLRDGWIVTQAGRRHPYNSSAKIHETIDPPLIYSKSAKHFNRSYSLNMAILGYYEEGGVTQVAEYSVTNEAGSVVIDLGRVDWADWDSGGDLLFSEEGKIYRVRRDYGQPFVPEKGRAKLLIDLNHSKFEKVIAPTWAKEW